MKGTVYITCNADGQTQRYEPMTNTPNPSPDRREAYARVSEDDLTRVIEAASWCREHGLTVHDYESRRDQLRRVLAALAQPTPPARGEADVEGWAISHDGPHPISDHRKWLARQLLDSKLDDDEAFGIVTYSPAIKGVWHGTGRAAPPPPQGTTPVLFDRVAELEGALGSIAQIRLVPNPRINVTALAAAITIAQAVLPKPPLTGGA